MKKVIAKAKWVKIAPRKLRRVAETVQGKSALTAISILKFMPQKGARILEKLVKSAVANARNNHKLPEESLMISRAFANKGVSMHRWNPRAKGRMDPVEIKTSHLTVELVGKEKEES